LAGPLLSRRGFKAARRRVGGLFLRHFGPATLSWLSRSWSLESLGAEHLERVRAPARGFLLSIWHGRMALGVEGYRSHGWHVLVSPSADGDLSDRLLRAFGYDVIRGSASRGGAQALRAMLAVLDADGTIVITPDGPRGPRHSMNPGLAWMARATGRPVLPAGLTCDRAWRLKSWDRFTIPRRGARVVAIFGEPVEVSREGGDAELARATQVIHDRMIACEVRGFEHLGVERDW
jgi:hypothetical protein